MAVSRHENGLAALATMIRSGLPAPDGDARQILSDLFGGRYLQRYFKSTVVRDAFSLSSGETDEGVPFAGLIHPDNPPCGSIWWNQCCLVSHKRRGESARPASWNTWLVA
jgi:hypothetical protein